MDTGIKRDNLRLNLGWEESRYVAVIAYMLGTSFNEAINHILAEAIKNRMIK